MRAPRPFPRHPLLPVLALALVGCASAPAGGGPGGAAPVARATAAVAAPEPVSRAIDDVRYTVRFDSTTAGRRSLDVAMRFRPAAGTEPVLLALPRWTPGAYELSDFSKWVGDFRVESGGRAVAWDKTGPQTWRIFPEGRDEVTVRFTYVADTLDNAMAWSRPDFAFFNGTNLFLYPSGRDLNRYPATVTIETQPGWRVATGMTPAAPAASGSARVFREESYHDLVDMPTFVGRFDLDSMRIAERWTYLATYPQGALAGEARNTLWRQHQQMIPPMARVFGEVPYRTYSTLIVFTEDIGGGSALEHQNSHVGIYNPGFIGTVVLPSITAHEIFHLWNVKRLRPAEMVPYEYDRWQPTTLLWESEGFTDYYADLALVRGGIVDSSGFLDLLQEKFTQTVQAPPVALEDASLTTWTGTADGSRYIYYPKGGIAGFLLDILIRDASGGRSSLDTVLRELYETTYKGAQGFTDAQFWAAASRAAGGRDFADFRRRYVDGREPLPFAEVLPLGGFALEADTLDLPLLGVTLQQDSLGLRLGEVQPGGVAEQAGLRSGDVLRSVGDLEARDLSFIPRYQQRYMRAAGERVPVTVVRDGVERRVDVQIRVTRRIVPRLAFLRNPGPEARRIREGILTGS